MSLTLRTKYLEGFVADHEFDAIAPAVNAAHNTLAAKNGPGNDFLGWVELPTDYDKEEFARIKAAAENYSEGEKMSTIAYAEKISKVIFLIKVYKVK